MDYIHSNLTLLLRHSLDVLSRWFQNTEQTKNTISSVKISVAAPIVNRNIDRCCYFRNSTDGSWGCNPLLNVIWSTEQEARTAAPQFPSLPLRSSLPVCSSTATGRGWGRCEAVRALQGFFMCGILLSEEWSQPKPITYHEWNGAACSLSQHRVRAHLDPHLRHSWSLKVSLSVPTPLCVTRR